MADLKLGAAGSVEMLLTSSMKLIRLLAPGICFAGIGAGGGCATGIVSRAEKVDEWI